MAAAESIFSPARGPSSAAAALRKQKQDEAARRQAVLDRLRRQHPEWQQEELFFAALRELNGGADSEFLRQAAARIAQWSRHQGVSLTAQKQ